MRFFDPQIILFCEDCQRASDFYATFGFRETFRAPQAGTPFKIEMELPGISIGLATPDGAIEHHGLNPVTSGHRACLTLWTDDVAAAYEAALNAGAAAHQSPHAFLDGQLSVAFAFDPDGHPVQLVQRGSTD